MNSPFTAKTLSFLRSLKRNNDRAWFRARKDDYERHVRTPMVAMLATLADDFARFAPEMISEPRVSLYRIYRDTRFSADKTPLKTHVAAHFPVRGMPKGKGGGLYFEIAPTGVWMGGGLYMPSSDDLRLIRARIADDHRPLARIATGKAFRDAVGQLEGTQLTRVPRGYPADHPAAHYLRFTRYFAGREFDATLATSPQLHVELIRVFRAVLPLVRYLNAAIKEDERAFRL